MMAASDKGFSIDKAVPRFVKQISVNVTDGAHFSQHAYTTTTPPGGNSL